MISLGLHASQSLQSTLSPRLQRAVKRRGFVVNISMWINT